MCGINQNTYGFVQCSNNSYSFLREVTGEEIITLASCVLESKVKNYDTVFSGVQDVTKYLSLKLSQYQREVFMTLYLSNKHQLISAEKLFYGSIDSAQIYPREIVKRALFHNAAAVILAHNHPSSGDVAPSDADKQITQRIVKSMALIGVRVVDHIIVGKGFDSFSFKAGGLDSYLEDT